MGRTAHQHSHRYYSNRVVFTLVDKSRQPAVERGQDSAALNCGSQQHGVRDLSISLKTADDLLGQVDDGAIKGPERVRLQLPEPLQQSDGFTRGHRVPDRGGIARNPNESRLRQGTGGPSVSAVHREPTACRAVMHVIGPGEGDEHIDIKQRRHGHSLSTL